MGGKFRFGFVDLADNGVAEQKCAFRGAGARAISVGPIGPRARRLARHDDGVARTAFLGRVWILGIRVTSLIFGGTCLSTGWLHPLCIQERFSSRDSSTRGRLRLLLSPPYDFHHLRKLITY